MISTREYFMQELGIDVSPEAAAADVVLGLFQSAMHMPEASTLTTAATVDEPNLPVAEVITGAASDGSDDGCGPAQSIHVPLEAFVQSITEMEQIPLGDTRTREQRIRLLRITAEGLPMEAGAMLDALCGLDEILRTLLADESVLPSRQPPKAARLECHQFLKATHASIKDARDAFEATLDALNEIDDSELSVYTSCEELYETTVLPRITVAECVLAVRVALELRTAEVVDFSCMKLDEVEKHDAAREVFRHRDIMPVVRARSSAVHLLREAFSVAGSLPTTPREHRDALIQRLDALGQQLLAAGVADGPAWVRESLLHKYTTSGRTSFRRVPSSLMPRNSGVVTSEQSLAAETESLLALVEQNRQNNDLNGLYDALGRVNLWLRRNGLARDVALHTSNGKVVPTGDADHQPYIPHDVRDGVWTKQMSERYETACVHYVTLKDRSDVAAELAEVVTLPDDQFVLLCHEDMLRGLLSKADDACVAGDARAKVEKRLRSLVMRIKVFYHNNETRVVTLPQAASLEDLRNALRRWMPDIDSCRFAFFDESDRVLLDSASEFEDLVRSTRGAAIAAGPALAGLNASLSVSTSQVSTRTPGCEIKFDLYVETSAKTPHVSKVLADALMPVVVTKSKSPRGDSATAVEHRDVHTKSDRKKPHSQLSSELQALRLAASFSGVASRQKQPTPESTTKPPQGGATVLNPEPHPPRPLTYQPLSTSLRDAPRPVAAPPRSDARPQDWSLPDSLASFGSLAQHTIVGDEGDEKRLQGKQQQQEHALPTGRGMTISSPERLSRAAQLRRLRSAGQR